MASSVSTYRICAVMAILFGVGILVLTSGSPVRASDCTQDPSQRVTAGGGEQIAEHLPSARGNVSSSVRVVRLSSSRATPGSLPECGPGGPVGSSGTIGIRPVRLSERGDGDVPSSRLPMYDRAFDRGFLTSIEGSNDGQPSGSSPFVSHAQGSLGTVRSVVLRL